MPKQKFKPGDRVAYLSWNVVLSGERGTVLRVQKTPNKSSGFRREVFQLRVILDTAEIVEDELIAFIHEKDYEKDTYIPF